MKIFFRFALVILTVNISIAAATFNVNTTADTLDANVGDSVCADASGNCSFRAALMESGATFGGDIIDLPAGTYTQTLVSADEDNNAGGDWDIRSDLVINGAGATTTILRAAASPGVATERVLDNVLTGNDVTLQNLQIINGRKTGAAGAMASRGGGVRNRGNMDMSGVRVSGNRSPMGGGIYNEGDMTIINSSITSNACLATSGACFGGGIYNVLRAGARVALRAANVSSNTTGNSAGGIGAEGTGNYTLAIFDSDITDNIISNGPNGRGGGVLSRSTTGKATVDIVRSFIFENRLNGSGSGGVGIAFHSTGSGSIVGTVSESTLQYNGSGTATGCGLFVHGAGGATTVSLLRSAIFQSVCHTGAGIGLTNDGGASSSIIKFQSTNSTVSGNHATNNGGGVFIDESGPGLTVATFDFSTIFNNSTDGLGGGVFVNSGSFNPRNSVLGGNTAAAGPDILGLVNSQNYNHIQNTSGAVISGVVTNNSTGNPSLGVLQNNGGSTLTHKPGLFSPVLEMIPPGVNGCGSGSNPVAIDQRGITRPQGSSCDKGSVELTQ